MSFLGGGGGDSRMRNTQGCATNWGVFSQGDFHMRSIRGVPRIRAIFSKKVPERVS